MSDVATPPAVPETPQPPRILIVDDQRNGRTAAALVLRQQGYQVSEAEGGEVALSRLLAEPFDVVLSDLKMAPLDGLAVLRGALEVSPSTQVIVMTGYGTVESAVEAMQLGAYDYLSKPFKESELLLRVQRALEQRRLLVDVGLFSDEFRQRYKLDNLVGRSAPMRDLLTRLVRVSPTEVTVLITGESGTGKELIARAIHVNSKRSSRPFVPVNCAAISETLLESELFGHVKGAFTGAVKLRQGLLEEASGGTFFFDEIAETTPAFQAKLPRLIQQHEIRPVGDNASIPVARPQRGDRRRGRLHRGAHRRAGQSGHRRPDARAGSGWRRAARDRGGDAAQRRTDGEGRSRPGRLHHHPVAEDEAPRNAQGVRRRPGRRGVRFAPCRRRNRSTTPSPGSSCRNRRDRRRRRPRRPSLHLLAVATT